MATSYLAVLRTPHATRTFTSALVGRLSYGIVFLAVILALTAGTGSFAVSGAILACFGLVNSVLSPVRAGLIDRWGPRRALPPMALAYSASLAALAAATWRPGAPVAVLAALTVAAGACTPPLGPVMRTLWSDLLPDRDLLRRAYSLDTVVEELLFVTGPLLAGVLAALSRPALGIAVSAALVLTGTLALVSSPAVRAFRPPARATAARRQWTPGRGQWQPTLVSLALAACLGGLGLLTVAFAARTGHLSAVAWVEAALAAGSAVGGLVYGAVSWRLAERVRLPLLAAAVGLVVAAAGLAANLYALAALVCVAGLFVAPALTTAYLVADAAAAPGDRTRAGAWVNTAYNAGSSGGTAGIGLVVGRLPLWLCFAAAAMPALLSVVSLRPAARARVSA